MADRYKVEVISYKDVTNKWGMLDHVVLANTIELLANKYDGEGYSMTRLETIGAPTMPSYMLMFERYDFDASAI